MHTVEPDRVEKGGNSRREGPRGGGRAIGERGRAAEAGHVERDHLPLCGEQVDHRLPDDQLGAERMQQDDRLTRSRAYMVEEAA